jgi:hypothetical protein
MTPSCNKVLPPAPEGVTWRSGTMEVDGIMTEVHSRSSDDTKGTVYVVCFCEINIKQTVLMPQSHMGLVPKSYGFLIFYVA